VLSRFEAERQALAVMDHPNIAKVLDGGVTDEGRPYFVMEYVKGMPITEFCDHAKVTVAGRLNLFVQICQAVQHAHQKGIIHRDLKPSNILVCLYDGQPVPKVIDFGLAKAIHQPLMEHTLYTAHGVMVGTPMQDLASSYYSVGRYAEALKLYEETLALQKAKFGLSNVDTLRCMRNLALTYMPSAGTLRPLSCARRRWRSTRPSSALTTPIRSGA
jgi:serine/threonine protein kinase